MLFTIYYITYLGQPDRTGAVWLSASVKVMVKIGHVYWKFAKTTLYYILYHISRSAWPDRGRLATNFGQSTGQYFTFWLNKYLDYLLFKCEFIWSRPESMVYILSQGWSPQITIDADNTRETYEISVFRAENDKRVKTASVDVEICGTWSPSCGSPKSCRILPPPRNFMIDDLKKGSMQITFFLYGPGSYNDNRRSHKSWSVSSIMRHDKRDTPRFMRAPIIIRTLGPNYNCRTA